MTDVFEAMAQLCDPNNATPLTIYADGIQEKTSNNGIIIDNFMLRDGAMSMVSAGTAATGTDQGTAALLSVRNINRVTDADGTKGVRLAIGIGQDDSGGQTFYIVHNASASALKVYPATGETINSLSANAPFIQSANSIVIYCATNTSAWQTVPNGGTAAMTAGLTAITHTAPTPDYAIQDLTQTTPFGFVTADEGNTALSVLANCQTQIAEIKAILIGAGLVPVA